MMKQRHKVERESNVGEEVGSIVCNFAEEGCYHRRQVKDAAHMKLIVPVLWQLEQRSLYALKHVTNVCGTSTMTGRNTVTAMNTRNTPTTRSKPNVIRDFLVGTLLIAYCKFSGIITYKEPTYEVDTADFHDLQR
ncbi:hypothetical protein L1987_73937 [Smallanthus sonchifolius]|uniref:Uncharacterized protein n=1 Tax=Smallanthus sonchifolius TaxID=185202 RepID=A0ACB9A2V9_9ASTR|nr:hypothetical protein L1987_73937 [Smallanthus sonchifolius]